MTPYAAPLDDMRLALDLAGLPDLAALPRFADATPDLIAAVLEEAGKFGAGVLAPLNAPGDHEGCRLDPDGTVRVPEGAVEAYAQFVEAGWTSLPFDPDYGGQGLPGVVGVAVTEIWQAANMAWALCPLLTTGTIEALSVHGTDEQKALYLPKLISGEWAGTMNLTESQAGSDLAALHCKAEPAPDLGEGLYRITGQKVFITHGDHEMAANICHMVLARLPDAPPGVKGISLFLVPKLLVEPDGTLGARNDVKAVSLEHKLGIHGSPTCLMAYGDEGGAIGTLVGAPHQGLACMFTMMNNARLNVGLQGVGIAERAYQQAAAFARDRIQGVDVANPKAGRVAIVRHPDIRRMLMTMRAKTEAARALTYYAAAQMDVAKADPDPAQQAKARRRQDLLVPVVKAWGSEIGFEVADLGIQIHGGTGYIEETGAAQHMRDARIARIYEGTNGIQAMDLVGRKVLRDQGAAVRELLEDMRATHAALVDAPVGLAAMAPHYGTALDDLEAATDWLLAHDGPVEAQAAATPYTLLFGVATGGWQMMRAALEVRRRLDAGDGNPAVLQAKLATAHFYADALMPATGAHRLAVTAGSDSLMAMADDWF
ncbi:acyl-CoA dehydrogenase [Roseospira marina]|uniref:Acyl-CoA dehydrogenase n=1 Tax=Roseospira marina TaxID=140057 RepID=A0A5M6IAJ9_9PROT|nr:acyl-CoA dehydrogenase [Roseospira marina]KAA5604688.1 acyl-CoA dehydrogenase [Roseospira marina]MBB4315135.1 alkylation response protein AidB-like acyl-CoA dehydrogenase [Roseospira marina]MBB5088095.1 alkylation response protein AidB-like acyl-CoA dehydrogenase [Roseospira marina]